MMKIRTMLSISVTILLFNLVLSASPATEYTFVREFGQPGPGSNQFLHMDGIGVDRFGTVFISDDYLWIDPAGGYTNTIPVVKRWSTDGMYEHAWRKHQNDQFWPPAGLDCSCDGDPFYVSPTYITMDYGATLEHTNPDGVLYEKFPPTFTRLPMWFRDVAVSADGIVYGIVYIRFVVSDKPITAPYVMKFEWDGALWTNTAAAVVTNEVGLSAKPWGIDADPWRRRVYVTLLSTSNGTAGVKVYNMDLTRIENHRPWNYAAMPTGVAVDNRNGTVLITETTSNMIYKYTRFLDPLLAFGETGNQPYQFNNPTDLDVDMKGWLYVADSYNDKVQVYAPPKEGNLNFLVYKSKVKVGWKQKLKGKDRDIIMCKAWAALDTYTNITSMIGLPFSFWCNELPIIPEMLPTKTNKKGNKALYKPDKNHKAKVQYRTKGALLKMTVKMKRGAIDGPLGVTDTDPLPPWLWVRGQMTLTDEFLGVHYMRFEHKNKVGKVYKAWKK